LLAAIFLETGRTPDEILAKPAGVRAFCYAVMRQRLKELHRAAAADRKGSGKGRPG
jgi:hypothetical protein